MTVADIRADLAEVRAQLKREGEALAAVYRRMLARYRPNQCPAKRTLTGRVRQNGSNPT
jgi:hypothetical protein